MLTPLDWHGAVRYLDFPERFINKGYNTTFAKLRAQRRFDELARRVKRIANQHAQHGLIDYKQRRAQLADWDGIDVDSWQLLATPPPADLAVGVRETSPRAAPCARSGCGASSPAATSAPRRSRYRTTQARRTRTQFIRDALADPPRAAADPRRAAARTNARPLRARTLHNRASPRALHQPRPSRRASYYLDTIDPLITERVLAHVGAHTGVDIPTPHHPAVRERRRHPRSPTPACSPPRSCSGPRRPPGTRSARRSAETATNSPTDNTAYQAARQRQPRLADELEQLQRAIENPHTPAPIAPDRAAPTTHARLASAIQARADELLATSHGADVARRASITVCREHTDLTCDEIAAIHDVKDAQPAFSRAPSPPPTRRLPTSIARYRQLARTRREPPQRKADFATRTSARPDDRPRDLTLPPRVVSDRPGCDPPTRSTTGAERCPDPDATSLAHAAPAAKSSAAAESSEDPPRLNSSAHSSPARPWAAEEIGDLPTRTLAELWKAPGRAA